jgi:hypothetical protein
VGVGVGVGPVGEGDGVGEGVGPDGEGDGVGVGIGVGVGTGVVVGTGVGVGTGPVGEGVVPVGDDGGVDAGLAGPGLIGDGTRVPVAVAMIHGSATVLARVGELVRAVGGLASVVTTGVGVTSSEVVAPALGSGIRGATAVGSGVASRPRRLSTPLGAGLAQSVPGSLRPARARPMHPPLASTATSTPTATRGAVGRG